MAKIIEFSMPEDLKVVRYILEGRTPVPCKDRLKWAKCMDSKDRQVGLTRLFIPKNRAKKVKKLAKIYVSTVFLGIDHNFFEGPPALFETMIFGGKLDHHMERYSTWEEAEKGHQEMLERVRMVG